MDAPQPKKEFAWQPLTPRGISKFSRAKVGRLWLVQFVFALILAGVVIWLVALDWFPVVAKSFKNVPGPAEIRGGRLAWPYEPAMVLGENRFFGVSVDLNHGGNARSPADVAVELGAVDYKIFSLFGYVHVHWTYPRAWIIALGRDEALPWWGAWSPVILALIAASLIASMLLVWSLLASLYFGPTWLFAFFANRQLTLGGSWRLTGAALMPGALFFSAAMIVYGLGWYPLLGLTLAFAAHIAMGWVYVCLATLKLPLEPEVTATKTNPFAPPPAPTSPQPAEAPNEPSTAKPEGQ